MRSENTEVQQGDDNRSLEVINLRAKATKSMIVDWMAIGVCEVDDGKWREGRKAGREREGGEACQQVELV